MIKYWDEKTKKIVSKASMAVEEPVEVEEVKVEEPQTEEPVEVEEPKRSRSRK